MKRKTLFILIGLLMGMILTTWGYSQKASNVQASQITGETFATQPVEASTLAPTDWKSKITSPFETIASSPTQFQLLVGGGLIVAGVVLVIIAIVVVVGGIMWWRRSEVNTNQPGLLRQDPAKPANSAKTETINCPGCRSSNKPDARFCKNCGSSLKLGTGSSAQSGPFPLPVTATPSPIVELVDEQTQSQIGQREEAAATLPPDLKKLLNDLRSEDANSRKLAIEELGKLKMSNVQIARELERIAKWDSNVKVANLAHKVLKVPIHQEMLEQAGQEEQTPDSEMLLAESKVEASEIAQKNMLYGALWCIGGIVVTSVTYSDAVTNGGGTYIVTWGAILFGGLQFLKGLFQYLISVRFM